ncbi:MAG: response regulator receiver protein [Pseudoxanthomonas suwonensis]|nr:MAG: response regulator receiver protein [Pseudoxanthomonas suwonensis]
MNQATTSSLSGNAPKSRAARAEYPPADYASRWPDAPPRMAPLQIAEATVGVGAMASAAPDGSAPVGAGIGPSASDAVQAVDAAYRVLIVEDDRSQGLFAQTILRGAGIESNVVSEATEVMSALRQLKPDLVLMDLHLERLTGTDLTSMIRSETGLAHMPIVFLTGDPDPERQFEVLEHGADDYLSKPVRPRLLISAVQSRIKRARALQQSRADTALRDPRTGLHQRQYVIDCINQALEQGSGGAVQLVEVQGAQRIHQSLGYAALELLMEQAGHIIGRLGGEHPIARLNDDSFLVFVPDANASQLHALSLRLHEDASSHTLPLGGALQPLETAIGYVLLDQGQATAGHVIDAAEQALRKARQQPKRVAGHVGSAIAGSDHAGDLQQVLGEDRLELVFQPVVAVAGGDQAQFQVLVRALGPDGTVRPARDFLPKVEEAGLMPAVDRWVMEQAIAYLADHPQRPARLFVTQSPQTLADDTHAGWLAQALGNRGVPRASLVIDLRLQDMQTSSATLRRFSEGMVAAGIPLCLSGYRQAPEYDAILNQLPLDYIRLSPDYSRGALHARDEIRMLIDRLHRQGIQVIAQQLEDPQEAALLWMSGIDFIQGNLVQAPQAALDFDFSHAVL